MFKTFYSDESGAVTVDWVVLTAALVGLGLAAISVVGSGLDEPTAALNNSIISADPGSNGALAGFFAATSGSEETAVE